jgi:hypothetical protein
MQAIQEVMEEEVVQHQELTLDAILDWIVLEGKIGALAEAGGGCVNVCNK